jgi:predicted DNA-binding protein with PD1-like motif
MRQHHEEGPLEMLGLEGNLIVDETGDADSHFHILMSKSSGEVIGGHLYDAEVFVSCEILLTEIIVSGVERYVSKSAGTPTIFINEE